MRRAIGAWAMRGLEVRVKALGNERAEGFAELARVGDGVAVLEGVGSEFRRADFFVGGNAAPEFVAAEVAVVRGARSGMAATGGSTWAVSMNMAVWVGWVVGESSSEECSGGLARGVRRAASAMAWRTSRSVRCGERGFERGLRGGENFIEHPLDPGADGTALVRLLPMGCRKTAPARRHDRPHRARSLRAGSRAPRRRSSPSAS